MTLSQMMTATASTTRHPAMADDQIGDPVTHLESVKITPPMLPSTNTQQSVRQAIGLEGTLVQVFECYTESHAHIDSSASVDQMPDIIANDMLITGGITYSVRWVDQQPPTASFGATLIMFLTKDKRA